jgi:hypothetical protein
VVRPLLGCSALPFYSPTPDSHHSLTPTLFRLEIATSADVPYGEIVFASLMNVVLGYDPVGWGVPYGGVFSADTAKQVIQASNRFKILRIIYFNACV